MTQAKTRKTAAAAATGTDKPEPKDTANQTGADQGPGVAPSSDVDAQREEEQQAALDAKTGDGSDEKAPSTDEASAEKAKADAEARMAGSEDGGDGSQGTLKPDTESSDDAVQAQRDEEAEAKAKARAEGEAKNEEEALLLAAAPGGQRTALTDGNEGSTMVAHTAGSPRPASGPLDAPVADVENLAASDDDPDNRVYADEAGPRDVFEGTEGAKARFVDADGNEVTADDMFEDEGKTFVTTKMRVYEVFTFPNTQVEGKRLAYAAGRRVPRGEAENVKNSLTKNVQIH